MLKYHLAAICLSGHTISYNADNEKLPKFCTACGESVITTCPSCNEPIHGAENVPAWVQSGVHYTRPAYCHNCGQPYPWTKSAIETASELIDEEMAELNPDEKSKFKAGLPDIVSNKPITTLTAKRISKYLNKVTPIAQETFKQIFYRFATDVAKAILWTV